MVRIFFLLVAGFLCLINLTAQPNEVNRKGTIRIDSQTGHNIQQGVSGFNVRIADNIWSYTHPDFIKAVHELKPGWLRYFSGTMGDAFDCATGLYDLDYISMFDHPKEYLNGFAYTSVKGPHRIIDLYRLLGQVSGKLVVTVNGFSETPETYAELARFCKNNHIEVEVWQFCNEPYFYVPSRDRYWWNDGYDYAAKMKPFADSILSVLPNAKLALNCSWDGIGGFMKEINSYQLKHGNYWNVYSKHSYAPHVGNPEQFDLAMQRLNSKVGEVTSEAAMNEIEKWSWKGVPLLITEFGVWNKPLNGIMSAIYNAEYTLRQLQHPNLLLIGSHEISNKYKPAHNFQTIVKDAFDNNKSIETDSLSKGIIIDDEGKALKLVHQATSKSDFTYNTTIDGGEQVVGLKGKVVEGQYARVLRGVDGFDYLIITNRSGVSISYNIVKDGSVVTGPMERSYMASNVAQASKIELLNDQINASNLIVPPFSVVMLKWPNNFKKLNAPRIYQAEVNSSNSVLLKWWMSDNAIGYNVLYGDSPDRLTKKMFVKDAKTTQAIIPNLVPGKNYWFCVAATDGKNMSDSSKKVSLAIQKPNSPNIFRTSRRNNSATIYWHSVANATGYNVLVDNMKGDVKVIDAKNVFGFRVENLDFDVTYKFSVVAYNGLGNSTPSNSETLICKKDLPIPPQNVSAISQANGHVKVAWINQDTIHSDIRFKVLRGTELYRFSEIASNIKGNSFVDSSAVDGQKYYYTIRSYTADGSDNYHPNIATLIMRTKEAVVDVKSIEKVQDGYKISLSCQNLNLTSDMKMGIVLADVSYLTEEETFFVANSFSNNAFVVHIPFTALKKGRSYALKGSVTANGVVTISKPPYQTITF